MGRLFGWLSGLALTIAPSLAWANEPSAGYKGIASIYFTFITAIRIYGVHDTFKNRKITIGAAIAISVLMFGVLLPKN